MLRQQVRGRLHLTPLEKNARRRFTAPAGHGNQEPRGFDLLPRGSLVFRYGHPFAYVFMKHAKSSTFRTGGVVL